MRVRAPARAGASLLPAVVAVLILLPPWAALAAPTVTVEVNGQILPLNPPAVLVDGRVLVPFVPCSRRCGQKCTGIRPPAR